MPRSLHLNNVRGSMYFQSSSRRRGRMRTVLSSDDSSPESSGCLTTSSALIDSFYSEAVISLSSAVAVREVVSKFCARKRTLVDLIGFGGILHLPGFDIGNSKFSLQLLTKIKWYPGTFALGDNFNLTITSEHIGKIIGISSSGLNVTDKCFKSDYEKSSFMKSRLSFLGTESDILRAAENFVVSDFIHPVDEQQCNNFKIAFVIFVMGCFLAPSVHPSYGQTVACSWKSR